MKLSSVVVVFSPVKRGGAGMAPNRCKAHGSRTDGKRHFPANRIIGTIEERHDSPGEIHALTLPPSARESHSTRRDIPDYHNPSP